MFYMLCYLPFSPITLSDSAKTQRQAMNEAVKTYRQTWFPDDQAIIEDPCLEQLFAPENPEPGPSDDPPLAQ